MLKLKVKRQKSKFGLPATLGLFFNYNELEGSWYERKPFALDVSWHVMSKEPWGGGEWHVNQIVAFDEQGEVSEMYRLDCEVLLAGPIKGPPLLPKHIEFRKVRGMPLEDNPHEGDTLHIIIEVMP
jgi:hypothetical protein